MISMFPAIVVQKAIDTFFTATKCGQLNKSSDDNSRFFSWQPSINHSIPSNHNQVLTSWDDVIAETFSLAHCFELANKQIAPEVSLKMQSVSRRLTDGFGYRYRRRSIDLNADFYRKPIIEKPKPEKKKLWEVWKQQNRRTGARQSLLLIINCNMNLLNCK